MDEMEEKLGAVLNNPQMMQQIMSMAQALGGGQGAGESPKGEQNEEIFIPHTRSSDDRFCGFYDGVR